MSDFLDPTSPEGKIAELRKQIAAIDVQLRIKRADRANLDTEIKAHGMRVNRYIRRVEKKRERLLAEMRKLQVEEKSEELETLE